MNQNFCLLCKIKIPYWKRTDSRFCGDECRKKYFDIYRRNLSNRMTNNNDISVGNMEVKLNETRNILQKDSV
jgi:hypothetical protein